MAAARRLVPLLNRVLVEKVVPPTRSTGGILLPDSAAGNKVSSAKVVAVGPGGRTDDGSIIPVSVKEGDTVLLPEYGGTPLKIDDKEYIIVRDNDILGILQE